MKRMQHLKSMFTRLLFGFFALLGWTSLQGQTVFVWPGDVNDNGVVNHIDLVYMGLHFGLQGTGRDSVSIDWIGYEVPKWLPPIPGRIDPAHADCNGDSVVNALDQVAIETNYGLDNGFITADSSSLSNLAIHPPLSFSLPGDSLASGATDTILLELGSSALPIDSLLGFAATVGYDTSLVDTAYLWLGNSWLGTPNVDLISLERYNPGSLAFSATRTDRVNAVMGQGVIGGIVVVMDDNLKTHASSAALQLEFSQALFLDSEGKVIEVSSMATALPIAGTSQALTALTYPNPASEALQIALTNSNGELVSGRFIDATGRVAREFSFGQSSHTLSCSGLLSGMYILELRQGEAVLRKRIVLIRE